MASFEQRGRSVRAVVRWPGGRKTQATFDTMAEAKAWAAKEEALKKATGGVRPTSTTVGELIEIYRPIAMRTDSAKSNRLRLDKWQRDPLAELRVVDVTAHDINEWIERQLTTISKVTGKPLANSSINRELNLMSAMFTYAVESKNWIKSNPVHGCQRPPDTPGRKRPLLTEQELEAIAIAGGMYHDPEWTEMTTRVCAAFFLSLETGTRSGELLRVRPKDYHRDRRVLHIHALERGGRKNARSGRATQDPSRDVPLTQRAVELLDKLLATMPEKQKPRRDFSHPPYIMGIGDETRDKLWRTIRDRSGVKNLTFHDTKHEAATRLAKHMDVIALSHALGTKDIRLLRDTYYNNDAERVALTLPPQLAPR